MGEFDPLRAIQEKITNLENHNSKLEEKLEAERKKRKEQALEIDNLRAKLHRAMGTSINESELERLRTENDRLLVLANKAKKASKAEEKLNQIRKILN